MHIIHRYQAANCNLQWIEHEYGNMKSLLLKILIEVFHAAKILPSSWKDAPNVNRGALVFPKLYGDCIYLGFAVLCNCKSYKIPKSTR